MLASVSKLVDKPFVVGFIIPVLLGVFAILALIRDLKPFKEIYNSVIELKGFTELTIAVLLLWVLAVLLLLLNHLLFRILEGYFGPFAWSWWRARKRNQYSEELGRLEALHEAMTNPAARREAKRAYYDALWRFHHDWPSNPGAVLPTRFGNVVRAFETYPDTLYGIDAIPGWVRLQGVMSKDFEALLEDAHAQVSSFVNICFLSLMFAIVAGVRFVLRCYETLPDLTTALHASWGYFAAFVIAPIISWLAYLAAVERAGAWGDLVRSAFDLYLPELAKKMGYTVPSEWADRRRFWQDVTSSFLYNVPMPAAWPLAAETAARCDAKPPRPQANSTPPQPEPDNPEPGESDTLPDNSTNGVAEGADASLK
jgi:hypothetical protein